MEGQLATQYDDNFFLSIVPVLKICRQKPPWYFLSVYLGLACRHRVVLSVFENLLGKGVITVASKRQCCHGNEYCDLGMLQDSTFYDL